MTTADWRRLRAGLSFTALWIVGFGVFTLYPVGQAVWTRAHSSPHSWKQPRHWS